MKTLDNLKAFSLKKKQMKQVGGGSYCTDLITITITLNGPKKCKK